MSLSDFIQLAAASATRTEDEKRDQIPVRVAPPGFRPIMGQLAHENRVSYSRFARYALAQGIAILDDEPWVIGARKAYNLTRADAMSRGDQDALGRLSQDVTYEFQRSQEDRTTLAISHESHARLAELAMVFGIPTSRLAVLVVLVSLLTLPNNRRYRDGFIEEVKAFRRFVVRRTRVLEMGDGTGFRQLNVRQKRLK